MSLKNSRYALEPAATLHLRDGNEELMYADGTDGKPDKTKPMLWKLFGPGSTQHASAKAVASARAMDRFKKKGKTDASPEEQAGDLTKFILSCTDSTENIDYDGNLKDHEMRKALLNDPEFSYIPAQIDKYLGDTANFTKASTKA